MTLYVGIDIGKASHTASLLSTALLKRFSRYELCPTLSFDNARPGFEKLLNTLCAQGPPGDCAVLLERTGHYGRTLEQYLQEQGIAVYQVHVQERPKGSSKSDKRDAQALAVLLYNQLERGVLLTEKTQIAHRMVPLSASAALLRGLVQQRRELVRETLRRRNKLTAICDELFPELTQIYKDPNGPSALILREKYPTPVLIAAAPLADLLATRKAHRPGVADMVRLQTLASGTIGTRDASRITSLSLEQQHLITEFRLLDTHVAALETAITTAVAASREGQILTSLPMIGPMHAAMLIAGIGSIASFASAAKLRTYAGWSPLQNQTGTSFDSVTLSKGGNRTLKHAVYLIALNAVKLDTPWKALYDRLVPLKCVWDERTKKYRGRMKVIGRIAGQIITVIYTLLKRDFDLLARTPAGKEPAPPECYDAAKHHIRRT